MVPKIWILKVNYTRLTVPPLFLWDSTSEQERACRNYTLQNTESEICFFFCFQFSFSFMLWQLPIAEQFVIFCFFQKLMAILPFLLVRMQFQLGFLLCCGVWVGLFVCFYWVLRAFCGSLYRCVLAQ